jgi:protein-S-isoprenylcysteine O-methyltransferase Ste14
LVVLGAALAGAAPAAELVGLVQPFRAASWFNGGGLVLALCGLVATLVAQYQMSDSWRIGVDARETTPLVTVGLFALVRNPIFSGTLLAMAGLFLMAPNQISAVGFGALILGLEVQVRAVEEPHLVRVHGTRYLAYAQAVGRFLPWIGRLS